ncbi:LysM peptidoglycan-binding domain-containing protein [Sphingomonas sp. ERG5]|uniref:LysM peptidoglycan-binding domain-containing protein n=1 Tax=Sphingomonas sp. ERG5 TaxID=1381597 RepID=UPI000ABBDD36|nr:LysM peptidoglycan-binding domain-containing protein [Sphingomonas sp. ERG5]
MPDPDGAGSGTPGTPQTTRYLYNAAGHVIYSVSAEGKVSWFDYQATGEQKTSIVYTASSYDPATLVSLTDADAITALNNWRTGAVIDRSAAVRTDRTYDDVRGTLTSEISWSKLDSTGAFITAANSGSEKSETNYLYNAHGELVERKVVINANGDKKTETFSYDGLGRVTSTTDLEGRTTTVAFGDTQQKTTVTFANGSTEVSVYNLAGQLITSTRSASDVSAQVTSYKYDALGRLRIAADPLAVNGTVGHRTFFFYDNVGRRAAEVDADGTLTEYRYNANNGVTSTTTYNTRLQAALLTPASGTPPTSLVDLNGNPTSLTLDAIRPVADPVADRWNWNYYDASQRLIRTIDATGAVTMFAYDGASQLTSTTELATRMTASDLAALKNAAVPANLYTNQNVASFWYTVNATLTPNGTIDGVNAFTLSAINGGQQTIAASYGQQIAVAAGDTLSFTIQFKSGLVSAAMAGFLGTLSSLGDPADSSAEILSGPGTLTRAAGSDFAVSGLSSSTITTVRVTRTFKQAESVSTRLYVGSSYTGQAANDSVVFANPVLTKKAAPANIYPNPNAPSQWNAAQWGSTLVADGTIDGVTAYRMGVQAAGQLAGMWSTTAASVVAGDAVSLTLQLKAGIRDTASIALRGSASDYGVNGDTTAVIVEGPGTLSQIGGGLWIITGLSTTVATKVKMVRTMRQTENLYTVLYVGQFPNGAATANDSIIVANPILTRPVNAPPPLPAADPANDRVSRMFYGADGQLIGTLDAEGYVSKIVYDKAGRKIETIARKTRAGTTTGDFATIFASASTNNAAADNAIDIHNWWLYDARGFLAATIDGEGGLTRFHYTPAGYVDLQTKGQKLDPATLINTPPTLAGLPAAPAGTTLETIGWTRNAFGQALTETRSLTGTVTTTTTYGYDVMRQLISTVTQAGGTDPRTYNQRYDGLGRLTSELSGIGSSVLAALSSPTQAQIDQVYIDYGTTYSYDAANRLTAKRGPKGAETEGARTLYYYTADGDLAYQIDALGDVTEYRYNSFGQRSDTIVYAGKLAAATIASWTGGEMTAAVRNAVTGLASAALDTAVHLDFNIDGTLKQSTDANGSISTFTYNAFGELVGSIVQRDAATIAATRSYDRRGLLKTEIVDAAAGGKAITTSYGYDAFGRAIQLTNANNKITNSEYDRDGRLVKVTDALTNSTSYTYDARDNLVAVTDADGKITRYVYDKAGRKIATIDALGGLSNTTYDADGRVVATRDYLNPISLSGLATEVTQGDAALTTALGNTNAGDRVTRYAYDKDGRLRFEIDGLGHVVEHVYDARGNAIRTVAYDGAIGADGTGLYSAAWIASQVAGLATAPGTRISRAVYDAVGRLTYSIDALGQVTIATYDAKGQLTKQVQVAALYTTAGDPLLSAMNTWATSNANATNDRTTRSLYDRKGQLAYGVDALGYVTRYEYDKLGKLLKQTRYESAQSVNDGTTVDTISITSPAAARVTQFSYDSAGRLETTTDPAGFITKLTLDQMGQILSSTDAFGTSDVSTTAYEYDAVGSVTKETRGSGTAEVVVTTSIYDKLRRLTDRTVAANTIDAATTHWDYDALGRVTKEIRAFGMTEHADTSFAYDALDRLVTQTDARGSVTTRAYDALGQLSSIKQEMETGAADDIVTAYTYDNFGNVWRVTDPRGNASYSYYDKKGRLTLKVDAEGYATGTTYTRFGEIESVTRYENRVVGTPIAGTPPSLTILNRLDNSEFAGLNGWMIGYNPANIVNNGSPFTDVGSGRSYIRSDFTATTAGQVASIATDGKNWFAVTEGARLSVRAGVEGLGAIGTLYLVVNWRTADGTFIGGSVVGTLSGPQSFNTNISGFVTAPAGVVDARFELYMYSSGAGTGSFTLIEPMVSPATSTQTLVPAYAPTGHNATTWFNYDKLGRLVRTTDAENNSEVYTLNAFGDRTQVRNKLGAVITNVYDKRGLLLTTTLPTTAYDNAGNLTSSTVVNRYEYDARGNRTKMVEADNLSYKRTTSYTYDKLDRLVRTTHDAVDVTANDLTTVTNVTPFEELTYDGRGNVIKSLDAAGAVTWSYYDKLDRRIAQVDARGALTVWTYNASGTIESVKAYGTEITMPPGLGGAAPVPVNPTDVRTTTFQYDRNNRITTSVVSGGKTGFWNGSAYVVVADAIITTRTYDAAGNVTSLTGGRQNAALSWYDANGRQIAQVDQEGYLTTFARDADGNVTTEKRFATKITATVTTDTAVGTLAGLAGTSTDDRTTTFEYDLMGRRTSETRLGVAAGTVDAAGGLTTGTANARIEYSYNALGEALSKKEANGDVTTWNYDGMGRQIAELGTAHVNQNGATVQQRTEYSYNGLSDVVRIRVFDANGNSGGEEHIATSSYGAGGRLLSSTDANNNVRSYRYDAGGRVIAELYNRTTTDGTITTIENDAVTYRYDILGRLIYQSIARKAPAASSWTFDLDSTQIRYNAYGEITGRGMNGQWQESYDYDATGHVWRSNAGDGSTRVYLYDKNGNASLTIETSGGTSGVNLAGYTLDNALALVTGSSGIGNSAVAGAVVTIGVFDKRNQQVETRAPFRELNPTESALIRRQVSYNAFGEVATEIDARGLVSNAMPAIIADFTTTYSYNTMGRLVAKQGPAINVTAENGQVSEKVHVTESYAYDLSGRLVAKTDANLHTLTQQLLAGSGHGDDAVLVLKEFHGDGGIFETKYDVFDNARILRNELYSSSLNNATGSDEVRSYDALGNVTKVTHRGGLLSDYYRYDETGRRIFSWNDQFNTNPLAPTIQDITKYDAQGRIVSQTIAAGSNDAVTSSTAFVWDNAHGYWVKTETNSAGLTATEYDDYFGRVLERTDFGQHRSVYSYDNAGRIRSLTNSDGGTVAYSWYNSGKIAMIVSNSENDKAASTATSKYKYDIAGNRVGESHAVVGHTYRWFFNTPVPFATSYQDANVTWDAMNRMVSFTDSGASGSAPVSINYEYDAVGNVRHMVANYRTLDDQGAAASTPTTQDYWYRYDGMNRFVTTMGTLQGARGAGVIVRGLTGSDIVYGKSGLRQSVSRTVERSFKYHFNDVKWSRVPYLSEHREDFIYRDDGQLIQVKAADGLIEDDYPYTPPAITAAPAIAALRSMDVRDALGRSTSHIEYAANGTDEVYRAASDYNYRNELVHQDTTVVRAGDSYRSNTYYDYRAQNGPSSFTGAYMDGAATHSISYNYKNGNPDLADNQSWTGFTWWDTAKVSSTAYQPDTTNGATNDSTYYFDDMGHLASVKIDDDRDRTVTFFNNAEGLIVERNEEDGNSTGDPEEIHYYFNGVRLGDTSNNGTSNIDYVQSIAQRTATSGTGPFAGGATNGTPYGDFDQSYDPINGLNYSAAPSRYTATSGDTLKSVATQLWGDASLWYMLASANGLSDPDAVLVAGQSLIVPAGVYSNSNSASTFRPYNPSEAQGDLSPTAPKPNGNNSCGVVGQILLVAVAVAVTLIIRAPISHFLTGLLAGPGAVATAGSVAAVAGSIAGAAITGVIASAVSQGVGLATGIQQGGFSWKSVALAGISAGVAQGLGEVGFLNNAKGILGTLQDIGRGAAGNAFTQGIAVATGLQHQFSWSGVAVGGAVGGVVGGMNLPDPAGRLLSGTAGAIVGGAVRSLIDGTNFGDNVLAALPDVIGSTIGGIISDKLVSIDKPINLIPDNFWDPVPDSGYAGSGDTGGGYFAGGFFGGGGGDRNLSGNAGDMIWSKNAAAGQTEQAPDDVGTLSSTGPYDKWLSAPSGPLKDGFVFDDIVVTTTRLQAAEEKHGFGWKFFEALGMHKGGVIYNIFNNLDSGGRPIAAYTARVQVERATADAVPRIIRNVGAASGRQLVRYSKWAEVPMGGEVSRVYDYAPEDPVQIATLLANVPESRGMRPVDRGDFVDMGLSALGLAGEAGAALRISSKATKLLEAAEGTLYKVGSGGVRGESALNLAQRAEVDGYLSNFDLRGVTVRNVDHLNLNTAYGHSFEVLQIGSDLVPGNVGLGTLTANSRVSIRGALGHEIVGHREAALAGRTQMIDALEEAQASIRAARFAPGLSSTERVTLLRDGVSRLQTAPGGPIRVRDVRDSLYINQR